MDYSKFISEHSKARNPSSIRALMPYVNRKDIISLGAGQPNPATFPFASMTVTLKNGDVMEMDPELFQRCLSYDATAGLQPLQDWLRELQKIEHQPTVEFDVAIGAGSQDLLTKGLEMMINPGDAVLVEDPSYTGALAFLDTQPCDVVGVPTDTSGMIPEAFESLLANWPASNPHGKKDQPRPKVLYTTPTGGNPSGVTISEERRKQMYDICHKYDIMILEDDAYYYLQFGNKRVPSYFSMDVDGRVLRCDSMSKILSSGLRIGWVTGPKVMIERINMHTMASNLQPSGVSQLLAFELLQKWGHDGFMEHVGKVSDFYREKRDLFVDSLNKYMKGRAEWVIPEAGMFVWVKLLGGITDSFDLVMNKALKRRVLAIPGVAFKPMGDKTPYIRLSFSNVVKEDMDEALRRLAEVIDEEAGTTQQ
ncbi:pyridoxal phosphate-dependent transferase [Halteromyces radiatus]|uniref:pyridoxal phosphate-dependent transferase n=1 Tax=Halteromyces radiatus TaxID=101107 RepID=UPI002220CD2F|nr:pyridoxal phosphate-dependent transferase [Halteromyces radiatus]KAI8078662.1 pyridoxal phosphate-dependent transferase [Halteromyces radiatus]